MALQGVPEDVVAQVPRAGERCSPCLERVSGERASPAAAGSGAPPPATLGKFTVALPSRERGVFCALGLVDCPESR